MNRAKRAGNAGAAGAAGAAGNAGAAIPAPHTSGSDNPALVLTAAAFGYAGKPRVTGLELTVPRGAAVALIGPNGSGKSTLLRGVLGLADLTAGAVSVLGSTPASARQRIGTLPQSDARDTSLPVTVRTVVTMGLYRRAGLLGSIGRAGREAVDRALERVGLAAFAGRLFGELSGGQQQRAILARALVSDPELLLLDEPFNGLDRENREVLLALVAGQRDEGRTVIVSTHDIEIARAACTHVLLLESGHEPGQPGHPAAFGGVTEVLDGASRGALTRAALQGAVFGANVSACEGETP